MKRKKSLLDVHTNKASIKMGASNQFVLVAFGAPGLNGQESTSVLVL